jgi:6-phosphogluconolactonase
MAPDPVIKAVPETTHIEISADSQTLALRAAEWISERIASTSDVFRIALSGGNTPRLLYMQLASPEFRERIEWRRVELFWGDERFVPHVDERSNYRMVREMLLAHAPVLIDHIHPVLTEGDPESAAQRYEAALKGVYGADTFSPAEPLFDLVLLGLGTDGHTASLFPGSPVLNERTRWVMPSLHGGEPRITLTYPPLESSRAVLFLVTGEEKAEAVRGVFAGDEKLPATRLHPQGQVLWFLDKAAAQKLPPEQREPACPA